jgi:hypothetical protein
MPRLCAPVERQDKMATRVGVACGGVMYKQYIFMVGVEVILRCN